MEGCSGPNFPSGKRSGCTGSRDAGPKGQEYDFIFRILPKRLKEKLREIMMILDVVEVLLSRRGSVYPFTLSFLLCLQLPV